MGRVVCMGHSPAVLWGINGNCYAARRRSALREKRRILLQSTTRVPMVHFERDCRSAILWQENASGEGERDEQQLARARVDSVGSSDRGGFPDRAGGDRRWRAGGGARSTADQCRPDWGG